MTTKHAEHIQPGSDVPARDEEPSEPRHSISFGEVLVYFVVTLIVLGIGLLLNEAVSDVIAFVKQSVA